MSWNPENVLENIAKKRPVFSGEEADLAEVAKLGRPFGVKGFHKIVLLTDFPERFEEGSELLLLNRSGIVGTVKVEAFNLSAIPGRGELKLQNVDDRDTASVLTNMLLAVPSDERFEPDDEDEFYPDELSGMSLLSEDAQAIGEVIALEAEVPSPYLTVRLNDGEELMIPFRKEFIESVSREDSAVTLKGSVDFHRI